VLDFLRLFLTYHVQKGFLHDSPMLRNSADVFFIAECMAVGNSLLYSINWPSLEKITAIKRKVKI
jgi:hypothetical protein